MKLWFDSPSAIKVQKMKQRVRSQAPPLVTRGIDQTRMVIEDGLSDSPEFSFLVIGDSYSSPYPDDNPQRQVAELMLTQREECRFVLHTGDVVYQVGSSEYYPKNFIAPYREFLVGGENYKRLRYDRMVFNQPFLPVLGNHDYFDVPWWIGIIAGISRPLRRLLRYKDIDVSWHGSFQGDAYARAFIDYLQAFHSQEQLERHLDKHYTAHTPTGRCLVYQPGRFTRLPNRYYTFCYGGIDFFALDSDTINTPSALPVSGTSEGKSYRWELQQRQQKLTQEKDQILDSFSYLEHQAEQVDELTVQLQLISDQITDIQRQLAPHDEAKDTDFEQLDWLRQRLIQSWQTPEVRGRIIYFHHPPYVTEASKWRQSQTMAVRHRLRRILDAVETAVGSITQGRPLVDLILNGHAHCLEYLRTLDTGHADSHLNWVVCGGSGFNLRRQREQGSQLWETFSDIPGSPTRKVAYSHMFIGRTKEGENIRRPYSFLRIDVKSGSPPQFILRPFVTERVQGEWKNQEMPGLVLGSPES